MNSRILFYRVVDTYGEFSNFALFPIRLDGKTWPTSEHYFQAMKVTDTRLQEIIRRAKTPALAARAGRSRKQRIRRDWGTVRIDVMRRALWAKFTQHDLPRDLLLATGDAMIVEHTDRDAFWGDGGNGRGKNWLGRLLMETRDRLRATKGK